MRRAVLSAALLLFAVPTAVAQTAAESAVRVTPVIASSTTATGQKIELPRDDARVVVSIFDIAPDATLPEHKHPFPRYAYVIAGTLRVTNTDTKQSQVYKAGDFIVEAIDQWHLGTSLGSAPVRLLVIDQVPGDATNTVLRK